MDETLNIAGDAVYLVSGATLADESVGPLFAGAADAHRIARTSIAGLGGTVRILRSGDAGWIEVARYTDTGQYLGERGLNLAAWLVVGEDEPVDWAAAGREQGLTVRADRLRAVLSALLVRAPDLPPPLGWWVGAVSPWCRFRPAPELPGAGLTCGFVRLPAARRGRYLTRRLRTCPGQFRAHACRCGLPPPRRCSRACGPGVPSSPPP